MRARDRGIAVLADRASDKLFRALAHTEFAADHAAEGRCDLAALHVADGRRALADLVVAVAALPRSIRERTGADVAAFGRAADEALAEAADRCRGSRS